jgi:chromosome segregation ATPase
MSSQDTSHSDNMQPTASMMPRRNASRKRLHGNGDAPDEQPRSDNTNENGSDPEQSRNLRLIEAITPFLGLVQTKEAVKADLASIDSSLARLREDVEQRVTLEDSKKVKEKVKEKIEQLANNVSQARRAVDTKAASTDLDRVREALEKQQSELQSVQDKQKQLATLADLERVSEQQASRDADLKRNFITVQHPVLTMQNKQKQFITSAEVQTAILDAVEDNLKSTMKSQDGLVKQISAVESDLKSKVHEIHYRIGTVRTILETSTAEYIELKQKIDGLVSQMNDERKERINLEKEVYGLRQDLDDAETTRQKDREDFIEFVKTLRQEREAEKRAHSRTAAQLVKKGDKLGKLEAEIAAVKNIQSTLMTKIDEDVNNKFAIYTASKTEDIAARLLEHIETTKDYVTKRMTSQDEHVKKHLFRHCKDLKEESDRAAEERLEAVREDFESRTAQLDIRLTENGKALSRYGKDVTRYVGIVDPITADIYALKEELVNHRKSLEDKIQEPLVQAKAHTDQSLREVDLSNTRREKSIWNCIDLVKTVQVGVLEAQMDEVKAQQERLIAEQNGIREGLDAQKKQQNTLKTQVTEARKEVDDRYSKLAATVYDQDSFLKRIPAYR